MLQLSIEGRTENEIATTPNISSLTIEFHNAQVLTQRNL
ncbi:MAG: hypothetical protein IPP12_05945 [Nitrospira sp.]|nr:hypothetical protein [Nitrospira sp.]MBK9946714.1 hypothetical protein [Nitrospira sp.]OYT20264.1 MAG: hypothetical protein CCU26_07375 [Nitrospira sp. UW-LDO-01]